MAKKSSKPAKKSVRPEPGQGPADAEGNPHGQAPRAPVEQGCAQRCAARPLAKKRSPAKRASRSSAAH